jgi:hypothetical protein
VLYAHARSTRARIAGMPTVRELAIPIPHEEIAAFCRKWGIRRLSFFGSLVRDDFDPNGAMWMCWWS